MIGMVADRDGWVRVLHSGDVKEGDMPVVNRTQEIFIGKSGNEVEVTVGDEAGGIRVAFFSVTSDNPNIAPLFGASIYPINEAIPFLWPVNCYLGDDGVSTQVEVGCPLGTPVSVKVYEEEDAYGNKFAG